MTITFPHFHRTVSYKFARREEIGACYCALLHRAREKTDLSRRMYRRRKLREISRFWRHNPIRLPVTGTESYQRGSSLEEKSKEKKNGSRVHERSSLHIYISVVIRQFYDRYIWDVSRTRNDSPFNLRPSRSISPFFFEFDLLFLKVKRKPTALRRLTFIRENAEI